MTSSKTLEKTYIFEYIKFAVGDGLLTAPGKIDDKLRVFVGCHRCQIKQWGAPKVHMQRVFYEEKAAIVAIQLMSAFWLIVNKQKKEAPTYLITKLVYNFQVNLTFVNRLTIIAK